MFPIKSFSEIDFFALWSRTIHQSETLELVLHIDGIEENLESPQLYRIRCLTGRWDIIYPDQSSTRLRLHTSADWSLLTLVFPSSLVMRFLMRRQVLRGDEVTMHSRMVTRMMRSGTVYTRALTVLGVRCISTWPVIRWPWRLRKCAVVNAKVSSIASMCNPAREERFYWSI